MRGEALKCTSKWDPEHMWRARPSIGVSIGRVVGTGGKIRKVTAMSHWSRRCVCVCVCVCVFWLCTAQLQRRPVWWVLPGVLHYTPCPVVHDGPKWGHQLTDWKSTSESLRRDIRLHNQLIYNKTDPSGVFNSFTSSRGKNRPNIQREAEIRETGGTSLVVQWLRFCALNAGDTGLIPGWGTKILHASQHGPPKIKNKKNK